MTDSIEGSERTSELTPARVAILVEFADSVAAGRRVLRLVAWVGAVATGMAMLAYYLIAIWHGWQGGPPMSHSGR